MSALWLGNDLKDDLMKRGQILPLSPEQIRARVLALISVALIILAFSIGLVIGIHHAG